MADIIDINSAQVSKFFRGRDPKLEENEIVRAIRSLAQKCAELDSGIPEIVRSGKPYIEIVYGRTEKLFSIKVKQWAEEVAAFRAFGPERGLSKALAPINGERPTIDWNAIRGGQRFYAPIDKTSKYWVEIVESVQFEELEEECKRRSIEVARPESVAYRQCSVEISAGEFDGKRGYFSRYIHQDKEIAIRFTRAYRRSQADAFAGEKSPSRINWLTINAGKPQTFSGILPDYFLSRATECLTGEFVYIDIEHLDRRHFHDSLAVLRARREADKRRRRPKNGCKS